MKCPKCNEETSELDEKCACCGINFEEYENRQKEIKNENEEYGNKTIFLRFIMAAQLIICIISAIVLWTNEEVLIGFIALFGGLIGTAFIKGFVDIVDLLDSINSKMERY